MACCGAPARVSSRTAPILIGEEDGSLLRARVTIGIEGLRVGEVAWFTGTSVPALVAQAILVPVP